MLEHQRKAFVSITKELFEIVLNKSSDYSDHAIEKDESDNITELGLPGLYVRMTDKMARLKKFMWYDRGNAVPNEGIEDSLKDLANYCIISLMVRRGLWQKPKPGAVKPGTIVEVEPREFKGQLI